MRTLTLLAVLAFPTALVLMLATAAGALVMHQAFIMFAASTIGLGLVAMPALRGTNALAKHLERLVRGEVGKPPQLWWTGAGDRLSTALAQLARTWEALDARTAESERGAIGMLDAVADPLVLLDAGRPVVHANAAAEALLGEDLNGRSLAAILRVPAVMAAADRVFAGEPVAEFSFEFGNDPPRHFLGHLQIMERAVPRGSAVALALHDVSELERVHRLRADFVANASHEIRTPLTTIIGSVNTLFEPIPEGDRHQFLVMIREHSDRIRGLVDDLLGLSRIEMAEHRLPQDRTDVGEILKLASSALTLKAHSRGVTLDLRIADGLVQVAADEEELQQVFENLIDNAIKYGSENTTVCIEARHAKATDAGEDWRPRDSAVVISVSDSGQGIPAEHISRLTERFYRVDKARSRQLGGTGLGLAIVKHIVARHRGALRIESTPGVGSRFSVCLDCSSDDSPGD